MPIPLTEKQGQIFDYLKRYKEQYEYMPSTREIADHFKFRQTAAENHLKAIQKKGHIHRQYGVARGIRILPSV